MGLMEEKDIDYQRAKTNLYWSFWTRVQIFSSAFQVPNISKSTKH